MKPKEYISPTIDECLVYSENEVAEKDGKGIVFTLPGDTMPVITDYGDWNQGNWSSMVWLDNDRIAFVRSTTADKGINILNLLSGDVYPCEDEIQREEVLDAMGTHALNWVRVTDRDKSGAGQFFSTLFTVAACSNYNEYANAEVKSDDENVTRLLIKVTKMEGHRIQNGIFGSICQHYPTESYCGIQDTKTSTKFNKIGKCPVAWADLTPDGHYLFTDKGILDMETKQYMTTASMISQQASLPPVVLAHSVSPTFDKVAILYGYTDHYVLDVVPFTMPN